MNDAAPEKKIIIDEDWKSQVEREREEAAHQQVQEGPQAPAEGGMPPASFELLVSTFFTQALAALGQFPDPETGQVTVHLDFAQLQIDLLDVLQKRTKGNLTPEESEMLDSALHQLRMAFLSIKQSQPLG